jgi:hypothetical protein
MAAYVKRNLTASCENLTTISLSSPMPTNRQNHHPTCHSTLSVNSLCPTLVSTVSHDLSPEIKSNDTSSYGRMTSEYLVLSTSMEMK